MTPGSIFQEVCELGGVIIIDTTCSIPGGPGRNLERGRSTLLDYCKGGSKMSPLPEGGKMFSL